MNKIIKFLLAGIFIFLTVIITDSNDEATDSFNSGTCAYTWLIVSNEDFGNYDDYHSYKTIMGGTHKLLKYVEPHGRTVLDGLMVKQGQMEP